MNSIKSKFDAIMQEALSQIPDLDIDSGFDPHEEPIEVDISGLNSPLTLENILSDHPRIDSQFLDLKTELFPSVSEDKLPDLDAELHITSVPPEFSPHNSSPSTREALSDAEFQSNQKTSGEILQSKEISAEERTKDFTIIQQEEESPVNPDIYDPRPHSPQSLSERLTTAGISDDLIDAAIRLTELTRAVETSVCLTGTGNVTCKNTAASSSPRGPTPSIPLFPSIAPPSVRSPNSSSTDSIQLLTSLGRFAEEQRATFSRASEAFSSEPHPAFAERSTAELLEPHIGCILALSAPIVHVGFDDPLGDGLPEQSEHSGERDEGTFCVLQKHDPVEFRRRVETEKDRPSVEVGTGGGDTNDFESLEPVAPIGELMPSLSAQNPSSPQVSQLLESSLMVSGQSQVRRTRGGVLIEVSESASAGIQAGGTSACGTNTNDLLSLPDPSHSAQRSRSPQAASAQVTLTNQQLGTALARMQREMGRLHPGASPEPVPQPATSQLSNEVNTSDAGEGVEERPDREQLERSLASLRRVLRV